jgi:hypothetical protein
MSGILIPYKNSITGCALRRVLHGIRQLRVTAFLLSHRAKKSGHKQQFPKNREIRGGRFWLGVDTLLTHVSCHCRWELDVMEYIMAQQSEEGLARLIRRAPPGLEDARSNLMRLAEQSAELGGVPFSRLVLGGFSQVCNSFVRQTRTVFFFKKKKKNHLRLTPPGAPRESEGVVIWRVRTPPPLRPPVLQQCVAVSTAPLGTS